VCNIRRASNAIPSIYDSINRYTPGEAVTHHNAAWLALKDCHAVRPGTDPAKWKRIAWIEAPR
jgi:hypothetical protein